MDEAKKKWRDLRTVTSGIRERRGQGKLVGQLPPSDAPGAMPRLCPFCFPILPHGGPPQTFHWQKRDTQDERGRLHERWRRIDPPNLFEERIAQAIENANEPADPDKAFFNSLLPALRRMPTHLKSAAKLKNHQIIHEIEFGDVSIL